MRAFLLVPREEFVLEQNLSRSYEHAFLDIGYGVTISGPHLVGHLTGQAPGIAQGAAQRAVAHAEGFEQDDLRLAGGNAVLQALEVVDLFALEPTARQQHDHAEGAERGQHVGHRRPELVGLHVEVVELPVRPLRTPPPLRVPRGPRQRLGRTDEPYNYETNPRGKVHVLATYDETTYTGGNMGYDHPIAWCQEYGGGRSIYSGIGHTAASYGEATRLPDCPEHLSPNQSAERADQRPVGGEAQPARAVRARHARLPPRPPHLPW